MALFALLICLAPTPGRSASMTARQLSDAHVGNTKTELRAQRTFSSAVIAAITSPSKVWRIAPRHRTCWTHVPWAHTCNAVRTRLLAHRWLYRVARARWQSLYAAKPAAPAVGTSWLVKAFLCIHRYEGSWTDDGAPYWGGLQFGWNEWQRFGGMYAPQANLATPHEQIQAGINYWRVSGFSPWPNTARACGLL